MIKFFLPSSNSDTDVKYNFIHLRMKQFFFAWIACCLLAFPLSAQEIKILTFNILHGERADKPATPNLADLANLLIQVQPEVIGLQEVDSMTVRSDTLYSGHLDFMKKNLQEKLDTKGILEKPWNTTAEGMEKEYWSKKAQTIIP